MSVTSNHQSFTTGIYERDGVWSNDIPSLSRVNKDTLEDFLVSLRDDLHVSDVVMRNVGSMPCDLIRKGVNLVPDWEKVGGFEASRFVDQLVDTAKQTPVYKERLEKTKECDVPFALSDGSLARVHLMQVRKGHTANIRIQPLYPPQLSELFGATWDHIDSHGNNRTANIVKNLHQMFSQPQGLVIICGPVRSGKTHLEHGMYEELNEPPVLKDGRYENKTRSRIYLVADPPEFIHENRYAIFEEREIGRQAGSYDEVLVGSMRVLKNVFGIGEMRGEAEVAEGVMRASINGSLIVTTAHTPTIAQAMNRFTTSTKHFPEDRMREMFKESIVGMVNLRLVPGRDGDEFLAVEFVNFVPDNKLKESLAEPGQLREALDTDRAAKNSQSLEKDIVWLIRNHFVAEETAVRCCDEGRLKIALEQA
jgi:Tfp pilus assembly pilus retraction ATPase PilT